MKNKIGRYIISILIWLLAIISIVPLIGNEDSEEWYATGMYQVMLLGFWFTFFLLFLLVGLILNKSSLKTSWTKFFDAFKYSILGTILIVGFAVVKYSIDFDNWETKSRIRTEENEKREFTKFNSTVDSLHNLINLDSTNSSAYFELGLTYRHKGQWERSIEFYNRAIHHNPIVSKYHSELAYSESFVENYDVAIKQYEIAYELDSSKTWIKSEIGRCEMLKLKLKRSQTF